MTQTKPTVPQPPPEYGDHHTCRALFNLSRSALYVLAAEGKIRSASVPIKGSKRGRRLFDCASIRAFLHSLTQTAEPQPAKQS